MESHENLDVWQISMTLAVECYELTKFFPKDEIYGLTSQIRRAAVSIPANIAEGFGRDQTGGFIQFLRIAQGSARELDTHLQLAVRLGLASAEHSTNPRQTTIRVSNMLRALIRSLEQKRAKP